MEAETELSSRPYRQWRRWSWASVVLVLMLAGGWAVWFGVAAHSLDAQLVTIRARNEPLVVADFSEEPISDVDNAAAAWVTAAALLPVNNFAPSNSGTEFPDYPPPPAWHLLANQSAVACAPATAAARDAAAKTAVQWKFSLGWGNANWPRLQRLWELSNVLADAAEREHLAHDDASATGSLVDCLCLTDVLNQDSSLHSNQNAIGMRNMLAGRVLLLAPDFLIGTPTRPVAPGTRPVPRGEVDRLIAELTNDDVSKLQLPRVIEYARATTHALYESNKRKRFFTRPGLSLIESHSLKRYDLALAAAQSIDEKSTHAIYGLEPTSELSWLDYVAPFDTWRDYDVEIYVYRLENLFTARWKSIALCRAAAVSLAVQLYRADHGNYPAALSYLVPAYLPAVPMDPCANTPMPITLDYLILPGGLPDGRPRHLVGFNGHGGVPPHDANYSSTWSNNSTQWRDLDRW